MNRSDMYRRLRQSSSWDMIVVGGGATGVGVAIDGATEAMTVTLHDLAGTPLHTVTLDPEGV